MRNQPIQLQNHKFRQYLKDNSSTQMMHDENHRSAKVLSQQDLRQSAESRRLCLLKARKSSLPLEDLSCEKRIGIGTYGKVYLLKGRTCVKKIIAPLDGVNLGSFCRETSALVAMCDCPQVVPMLDARLSLSGGEIFFPRLRMDLSDFLRSAAGKISSFACVRNIAFELAKGLHALFQHGIYHLDLKPANVLLTEDYRPVIADFGIASYNQDEEIELGDRLRRFCPGARDFERPTDVQTYWYRAPEILSGSRMYDHRADIWSYGLIVLELLTLSPAVMGKAETQQLQCIYDLFGEPGTPEPAAGSGKELPSRLRNYLDKHGRFPVDPQCLSLLESALRVSPQERANIIEIVSHPFFAGVRSISRMSSTSPQSPMPGSAAERLRLQETYVLSPTPVGGSEVDLDDRRAMVLRLQELRNANDAFGKSCITHQTYFLAVLLFDSLIERMPIARAVLPSVVGTCLLLAGFVFDRERQLRTAQLRELFELPSNDEELLPLVSEVMSCLNYDLFRPTEMNYLSTYRPAPKRPDKVLERLYELSAHPDYRRHRPEEAVSLAVQMSEASFSENA
ncbi:MAG: protein kinase domain-containing protein [Sulfobacillus sp.]